MTLGQTLRHGIDIKRYPLVPDPKQSLDHLCLCQKSAFFSALRGTASRTTGYVPGDSCPFRGRRKTLACNARDKCALWFSWTLFSRKPGRTWVVHQYPSRLEIPAVFSTSRASRGSAFLLSKRARLFASFPLLPPCLGYYCICPARLRRCLVLSRVLS